MITHMGYVSLLLKKGGGVQKACSMNQKQEFSPSILPYKDAVKSMSQIIWLSRFHTLSARSEEWEAAGQQTEQAAKSAVVLAAECVLLHVVIKYFIMSSV